MPGKTNVHELTALVKRAFGHLELAQVNDHALYVLNFKGDFPFHQHTKDELYLVLEGEIRLRFLNAPEVILKKDDCTVVPAYTSHSCGAEKDALVLMVKPKGMFAKENEDSPEHDH